MKSKKRKIVIIIHSFTKGGGAEKIASMLTSYLHKNKYSVAVLTFYKESNEHFIPCKTHCLHETCDQSIFWKIKIVFHRSYSIARFCRDNNIDTIISFMPSANIPVLLSRLFGNVAKKNISIRCNPFFHGLKLIAPILLLYRFAQNIVVPTSALKKQLHKRLFIPKNKVSVIPNFSHNKKGGNNTMLKNNTVLSVGRLVPEKNHQLLLEASKRFADFSHQTHVQILGDGALRPLLEDEIKKYNLEKHVFLLGYSDDTYRHYYNANCFVSTSLSEGFPNVFLEAMSAGLPIVCLDTNFGPREILLKPLHPHKKNIDPIIDVYQHEKFSIINPSVSELESKLALEIIRLQILNKGSSINWSKHLDYFSEKSILPQWETLLI